MIIFISVFSFLLDGILSKYLIKTIFAPMLTIVSLVIIYPYFNNNNYRYLKYNAIIGLLYDIVYMDTIFYNFFLFLIIGLIVIIFNYLYSSNCYISLIETIISIIFYRFIDYGFVIIFRNYSFSFSNLLESIYSSMTLNIIYCLIIYIIANKYSKKHHILRSK